MCIERRYYWTDHYFYFAVIDDFIGLLSGLSRGSGLDRSVV